MKRKLISIAILILSVAGIFVISGNNQIKANEQSKTRYNLCCFIFFADEEDEINKFEYGVSRKQIIDNTYNASIYSYREYFKSVSNGNTDLQTVYLFPEKEVFSSFKLDNSRNTYAKKSDENPDGYENETLANALFQIDWSSKIQAALDKGILPCTIDDRNKTISLDLLDGDGNGEIDCITLIFAPQKSNNYSVTWGEPLYPCKARCGRISIKIGNKTVTSGDYNQWVGDYSTVYKESETSNILFLTNGVGIHEMGHMFGFRDLYDYNRVYYPVGNMSIMSNTLTPVPQFMTSYEREIQGWLNSTNIKQISKSGIYELDPVTDSNSGVVCYKMPLEGFENKWLYIEYRVFDDPTVNRFDSKNRGLYLASGTKLSEIAGKSGVVVYIVDVSNKYPTNSSGNPKLFGIDVFGGSNKNRTDAPRTVGDIVYLSAYNSDGVYKSTGCQVEIIGFENGKAQVKITSPYLSDKLEITAESINNSDLYNKLVSLSTTGALYDVSLDKYEYLDLSFLKIKDIDFLSCFNFKNLKYLVLAGNSISNVDSMPDFIKKHPDVLIILDNNCIDLDKCETELLNHTNILYGIQNINANKDGKTIYTKPLTYHINESFPISDYSIMYTYENGGSTKQFKRGLNTLELTESGEYTFNCIYFFDERNNVKYLYQYTIEVPAVRNYFELSSDMIESEIDALFSLPLVPNGEEESDYRINIFINGNQTDKTITDKFKLSTVGESTIKIDFTRISDNEQYSLSLKVKIVDKVAPLLSIIRDGTYITVKDFTDPGIEISDNSVTKPFVMTEQGTKNGFTLEINIQYSEITEGNLIKSVLYTYNYKVTDPSGNTSSVTRNVEIYNEKYIIKNESDGFTVSKTVFDKNENEIPVITANGEYTYCYSITDQYGKTVVYSEEVTVTDLEPTETDKEPLETDKEPSETDIATDSSLVGTETDIQTDKPSVDHSETGTESGTSVDINTDSGNINSDNSNSTVSGESINTDSSDSESGDNRNTSMKSKLIAFGIIFVMVATIVVIVLTVKKI